MATGLSAVCATCNRYWMARDHGIPGDTCTSKTKCGSPLAGDNFHDYSGPLEGALSELCFVCGQQSNYGIRVNGSPKTVGACDKHIVYVQKYQAKGQSPVSQEVRSESRPSLILPTAPKKDLVRDIQEVENYYAKKGIE